MKFYVEIPISQNALELPPEKCENPIPFSTDQDPEIKCLQTLGIYLQWLSL